MGRAIFVTAKSQHANGICKHGSPGRGNEIQYSKSRVPAMSTTQYRVEDSPSILVILSHSHARLLDKGLVEMEIFLAKETKVEDATLQRLEA